MRILITILFLMPFLGMAQSTVLNPDRIYNDTTQIFADSIVMLAPVLGTSDSILVITGNGSIEYRALSGLTTDNFANADLIATGSRVHIFNGHNLMIGVLNGGAAQIAVNDASDTSNSVIDLQEGYAIVGWSDDGPILRASQFYGGRTQAYMYYRDVTGDIDKTLLLDDDEMELEYNNTNTGVTHYLRMFEDSIILKAGDASELPFYIWSDHTRIRKIDQYDESTPAAGDLLIGDGVDFEKVAIGSPGEALTVNSAGTAVGWEPRMNIMQGVQDLTVNASTTTYTCFAQTGNAIETRRQMIMPIAGTLKTLYVTTLSTQDASGDLVVTVRKNGAGTALTTTISAGSAAGVFTDLSNSVTVAAGDKISIELANAATAASARVVSITAVFEY